MYADYVFPDLSYLEQWASPGDVPQPAVKSNPIRQPAAPPIPDIVTVAGEEMPISMEAVMFAIADRLKLPGFGASGFKDGLPLKRPEDYFLKVVANLAFGEKADGSDGTPEASQEEQDLFLKARRHLPPPMFDATKWQAAVGPTIWRVVYVLNRGSRFEQFSGAMTATTWRTSLPARFTSSSAPPKPRTLYHRQSVRWSAVLQRSGQQHGRKDRR